MLILVQLAIARNEQIEVQEELSKISGIQEDMSRHGSDQNCHRSRTERRAFRQNNQQLLEANLAA